MLQVSPMTTHRIAMNVADVVMSSDHRNGETFQNDGESARCDVKAAGLEPDTIRIRNPETIFFYISVGNEVFATPPIRIEAVAETVEGSDRHMSPFSGSRMKALLPTLSREPLALQQSLEDRNSRYQTHTSISRQLSFPKPHITCHDLSCRLSWSIHRCRSS